MNNSRKHDYREIQLHYENCLLQYGDSHKGVDWPNIEDADKRYRIMLSVVNNPDTPVSLLDFGCGAAHLLGFLESNTSYQQITYDGLDISPRFIELCKNKHPNHHFYCTDILTEDWAAKNSYDYVILNGVFTEKLSLDHQTMWDYFKNVMHIVFDKAEIGVAFNVMSTNVDWQRDDLFHLSTDQLTQFLTKELSRNFIIRNDYGLYEYTTYLYK